MDAIAHSAGRNGEHPPQLAASQNSDGRTWKNLSGLLDSRQLLGHDSVGLVLAILLQFFAQLRT